MTSAFETLTPRQVHSEQHSDRKLAGLTPLACREQEDQPVAMATRPIIKDRHADGEQGQDFEVKKDQAAVLNSSAQCMNTQNSSNGAPSPPHYASTPIPAEASRVASQQKNE